MSFWAQYHTEEDVEDISDEERNSPGAFIDSFMIGPLNEAGQRLQDQKTEEEKNKQRKSSSLSIESMSGYFTGVPGVHF